MNKKYASGTRMSWHNNTKYFHMIYYSTKGVVEWRNKINVNVVVNQQAIVPNAISVEIEKILTPV